MFNTQLKNNLNTYVGLSLQVPIFNSLKTKTQSKLGKINYHQAQLQLKTTEIRFRSLIEQTCNELASAYERYLIYQEQVNDYSSSFDIAKIKFEQGSITTVEYMTAKNNFERARVGFITTQYEYLLKKEVLNLYKKQ
jgi:outer membrane protein